MKVVGGFLLLAGLAAALVVERRQAGPQKTMRAPRDPYTSIKAEPGADEGRIFSELSWG